VSITTNMERSPGLTRAARELAAVRALLEHLIQLRVGTAWTDAAARQYASLTATESRLLQIVREEVLAA
jgi:hypothetical protein